MNRKGEVTRDSGRIRRMFRQLRAGLLEGERHMGGDEMNRHERTEAALKVIKEATAKGFMNCKAIVRALYPDRYPDRPVRWEAAYRWMADAGVEVVYLAPDGDTDVRKAERTGCWAADFPPVLAYKEAYYLQIGVNDWTRNVKGALEAGLSQDEAEEMMGPSPPAPAFFVDTAWKATGTKPKQKDPIAEGAARESDTRILCMKAIADLLSGSIPLRHLHLVEALPEWATENTGALARALSDMVAAGEIVVTHHDGFNWYALAASSERSSETRDENPLPFHDYVIKETGTPENRNVWVGETRLCLIVWDEFEWKVTSAALADMFHVGFSELNEVKDALKPILDQLPGPAAAISTEVVERQDAIALIAMRVWTGPVNKKGRPKPSALSAMVGFGVTRERRNRLWAIVEGERDAD